MAGIDDKEVLCWGGDVCVCNKNPKTRKIVVVGFESLFAKIVIKLIIIICLFKKKIARAKENNK